MPDRLVQFENDIRDGADNLPPDIELGFRKMFGGMGAYTRGRIFAVTSDRGWALKLAPEDIEELLKVEGARYLEHTPGIVERKYVVPPPKLVNDLKQWQKWVERSIAYAQTLPLPKKRSKK
jgi:TfoX/Sxy family transcriptional regulator of competence genes